MFRVDLRNFNPIRTQERKKDGSEHIVRKVCLLGVQSILITEEMLEYSSSDARK